MNYLIPSFECLLLLHSSFVQNPWVITLLKLCGFWTKVSTLLDFVTCSMANLVYNIIFSELKAALEVRFFIVIPDLNVLILFYIRVRDTTTNLVYNSCFIFRYPIQNEFKNRVCVAVDSYNNINFISIRLHRWR